MALTDFKILISELKYDTLNLNICFHDLEITFLFFFLDERLK